MLTRYNYAPDAVGGYNVNSIVLGVPITMLTVDGKIHHASDKQAVIGTYGSTARQQITVRHSPNPEDNFASFQQVNREGNSLINELIIGTGFKNLQHRLSGERLSSSRTSFWNPCRQES